jgi:hypothetical protein
MEYQNNIQGESFVIVGDHYDVKELTLKNKQKQNKTIKQIKNKTKN